MFIWLYKMGKQWAKGKHMHALGKYYTGLRDEGTTTLGWLHYVYTTIRHRQNYQRSPFEKRDDG